MKTKRWKCPKCRCGRTITIRINGSGVGWAVGGGGRFCLCCSRELTPAEVARIVAYNQAKAGF